MSELKQKILTAETIGKDQKPTKITVNSLIPLEDVGAETKYILKGTVGKDSLISLIQRDAYYGQQIEKNWEAMKKIGLPVVPTLRKLPTGELLVTDMKADGSQIYGKAFSTGDYYQRPRPQIDKFFS